MKLFVALVVVLAFIANACAETIATSSRYSLLDNSVLLKGLIGEKLTPALTHPTFSGKSNH